MHPGWAAQSGITAAALARQGFVGPSRAYEGRFGAVQCLPAGGHRARALGPGDGGPRRGLGDDGRGGQAAAGLPLHACLLGRGARAHQAAQVRIGDIERIKALVPAEVVKTVCEPEANKRRPANAYDAQFSIPYLVAASLVRGHFTLAELEPEVAHRRAHPAPVRPGRLRGRPALDLPAPLHRRGADLAEGRPQARASRGHEPRLRRPPAVERRHRRQVHRQRAHEPVGPAGRRSARRRARPRGGERHTRRSIDRICQAREVRTV